MGTNGISVVFKADITYVLDQIGLLYGVESMGGDQDIDYH
jgi:hypothetical protein